MCSCHVRRERRLQALRYDLTVSAGLNVPLDLLWTWLCYPSRTTRWKGAIPTTKSGKVTARGMFVSLMAHGPASEIPATTCDLLDTILVTLRCSIQRFLFKRPRPQCKPVFLTATRPATTLTGRRTPASTCSPPRLCCCVNERIANSSARTRRRMKTWRTRRKRRSSSSRGAMRKSGRGRRANRSLGRQRRSRPG